MKHLLIPALALIALASCAKNEISTSALPEQEITFQTVINPVSTKAETHTQFGTDKVFFSSAFMLTGGKTYNTAEAEDFTPYISASKISYNPEGFWRNNDKVYYWPKDNGSSLTFYAWSDYTNDPSFTTVGCTPKDGIYFTNYNTTTVKNKVLLVADVMKDQKKNDETDQMYLNGVKTLFRQKLSDVELFVKTDANYGEDTKIYLRRISFDNIGVEASYNQSASVPASEGWTNPTVSETCYGSLYESNDETNRITDASVNHSNQYRIVMPQSTASVGKTMTLVYQVVTNYTGTDVVETVTVVKSLGEVFDANWEMGKRYILTITIGLDQILWDPAVENWTDVIEGPINV